MTLPSSAIERTLRRGRLLTAVGAIGAAVATVVAWRYSPIDAIQGPAFRIMYLHVPAAVCMEVAFVLVGVVGILFLWLKDPRLDAFGEASAEAGLFFGTLVLLTGPLWGKAVWGTWWQWEPRLTFTLLVYLLFSGYFALRSAMHEPLERARFAAVVGIMGMVLVPFIHLAVSLWPSQHPPPVLLRTPTNDPTAPRFDGTVVRAILVMFAALVVLYVGIVTTRYGIGLRRAEEERRDVA